MLSRPVQNQGDAVRGPMFVCETSAQNSQHSTYTRHPRRSMLVDSLTEGVWSADSDLDQLCQEFPDFDRGLLEGMLADQGGDVPEVHACLRVCSPHRPQKY